MPQNGKLKIQDKYQYPSIMINLTIQTGPPLGILNMQIVRGSQLKIFPRSSLNSLILEVI